jgi:phosphatidylserine/phosphatidylglycerophosphate/cardiolipin synthase-like enzyme
MKFNTIKLVFAFGLVFVLGLAFLFCLIKYQKQNSSEVKCYEGNIVPVFSPYNSEEIFNLIKNAKYEIKVEVYEFSYKNLADALIDARERNVSVKVVLEPSVYQNSGMSSYLLNGGISVNWASKKFHNTHSKFMIIDDSIVFVGSLNWSENAMKNNREASVIIYSKEVSGSFEKIFDMDFNT